MIKKWKPSLKQLQTYAELLLEQNKVRREILRKRAKISKQGDRRNTIPDLVVPKHVRIRHDVKVYRSRFSDYSEYRAKVKELKRLYGRGFVGYYKEVYKRNILEGWRDSINTALRENGVYIGNGIEPASHGYYSKEQIEEYGDIGEYMKLYNRLVASDGQTFQDMYENGYITPLKYIYQEMLSGGKSSSISFLDEQNDLISIYRGKK